MKVCTREARLFSIPVRQAQQGLLPCILHHTVFVQHALRTPTKLQYTVFARHTQVPQRRNSNPSQGCLHEGDQYGLHQRVPHTHSKPRIQPRACSSCRLLRLWRHAGCRRASHLAEHTAPPGLASGDDRMTRLTRPVQVHSCSARTRRTMGGGRLQAGAAGLVPWRAVCVPVPVASLVWRPRHSPHNRGRIGIG